MTRKEKKEGIRNIFINLTRKKSKEQILNEEKDLGRKLSRQEKHKIIMQNAKKLRRNIAFASFFALGGIVGLSGNNLLHEAQTTKGLTTNNKEITIDASEAEKDIRVDSLSNDSRSLFVNGYKVDLNEIDCNEQIPDITYEEVDNLKSSQAVLDYIKKMYISKYNANGENINLEDVTLYASRLDCLYTDHAKNGDDIVRIDTGKTATSENETMQSHYGTISVTVKKGDTILSKEIASNFNGTNRYVPVYNADEVVEKADEPLYGLGEVIFTGIHYSSAMKTGNSFEDTQIHKKNFLDALVKYKQSEIDKTANEHLEQDKENTGFELGD